MGGMRGGDFLGMAHAVLFAYDLVAKWQVLLRILKTIVLVKEYRITYAFALGRLSKHLLHWDI